ncbi:hypothetical protein [Candidatus Symbiobacter mobilis]|uniref:hypothetical protein n=1 Tax=Candidatus Symbiobacter mobilis TaxID=1436290 RepID=UPI001244BEFA|nr:hypothetical protein [Candidatus Symbiobacter mobilis]
MKKADIFLDKHRPSMLSVCKAISLAEKWHRGQLRKNGLPFLTHPLAVWQRLSEEGVRDSIDPFPHFGLSII